ncbi:hypothetical protein MNBD_ALPHA06-1983 [hydrothermal vent metagenome]|uniref:Peptidoglycan binding-like domain-containing protein n=1 Tax=hydrothermal vent metagenome TaxID=652676 RepID=A0A3B0S4C3_9ZZZZ
MKQLKFLAGSSLAILAGLSLTTTAVADVGPGSNFPFDAPPQGKVGECFARVMVPAQYETVTEQVVVDEGGNRIQVTAPQFAPQTQQYTVRENGVRYEVRQPTYRTVSEQVMVRPAYETLHVVPGEYRTVTEQVQISAPRLAWKPGASLASRTGIRATKTHQGEVYCLVEEPGETKSVSKRVQVRAEQVRAVMVPPVYQNITREVMVDPGGVREIPIPAKYANLTIQQLVQPAGQVSTAIAPRMGSVTRRVQTSGESFRWVKVLCETNATPSAISEVQTLLHDQGYYQGPISGQVSGGTETAIARYQQRMNIPHGGFLSLQTIDSLRGGHQAPAISHAPVVQQHASVVQQHAPVVQQHAPVQYQGTASWTQGNTSVRQTHSSYGQQSGNWSGGHSGQFTSSQSGPVVSGNWSGGHASQFTNLQTAPVISQIPRGEHATDIQPAATLLGGRNTGGAQQWHRDSLLGWSGK